MSTVLPSPVVALTPIRSYRSKRPFSTAKHDSPLPGTPTPRPRARSTDAALMGSAKGDLSECNLQISSLDFAEFSARKEDGSFGIIPVCHIHQMLAYLGKHYNVIDVAQMGPYLELRCEYEIPEPTARPFTVAGCLAIWLLDGSGATPEILPKGFGLGEYITIDEELADDLNFYQLPKVKTLLGLSKYFPDAEYISYLSMAVIIELPQLSTPEHRKRLEQLPAKFDNAGASLQYHNGPMARKEMKRSKIPDPKFVDGQYDGTDYVKEQGCFYPGAMITSNEGSVSAGILVEKDSKLRLTVAFHCWEEENEKHGETLGDPSFFKVMQGETHAGHVAERIGSTDIGLAKLDVPFSNRFLGVSTTPRTLLASDDIGFFDEFIIDSFVTGFQRMACLGVRIRVKGMRERELKGKPALLPTPGTYVSHVQGIFATSAPENSSKPKMRTGVCGSALVLILRDKVKAKESERKKVEAETLAEGAVGGFMHWSDLQSKSQEETLLCYADTADALIETGWEIHTSPEKRQADADEIGESSSKKHSPRKHA